MHYCMEFVATSLIVCYTTENRSPSFSRNFMFLYGYISVAVDLKQTRVSTDNRCITV